jgi:hypothetical protein
MHHHYKPSICLLVHIEQTLCPAKRHWRDGRNFKRLVGVRRTINLKQKGPLRMLRECGIGTWLAVGHLCLRTVKVWASDRVFSDIVSTSVSKPINTYKKAALATSKTGLIRYIVRLRRSCMERSIICGDGAVKATPSWPGSPWTASPRNK